MRVSLLIYIIGYFVSWIHGKKLYNCTDKTCNCNNKWSISDKIFVTLISLGSWLNYWAMPTYIK